MNTAGIFVGGEELSPRMQRTASVLGEMLSGVSLETMLTHPMLFDLPNATPLQRAFCRVAEGRTLGDMASDPAVQRQGLDGYTGRPKETALVAGVRSGKSKIAAAMCAHAAMTANLNGLGPGDIPRAVVVSARRDNALAVYRHLAGAFKASPVLRSRLLTDPDNSTSRFMVRHPSGRPVEMLVVAASAEGVGLTSFWVVCCVLDEYARMTSDETEGVINWASQRKAVLQRIRPGGYLVHITSPLGEVGAAYEHATKDWQHPSRRIVVFRGRGDEMNPVHWTPQQIEEAKLDPETYRTDFLGEFASPETQLFHGDHIRACMRADAVDLPRDPRASYTAWMDPATRGNGWTFAIFTRVGKQRIVAAARECAGSSAAPLNPEHVFRDTIGPICKHYGVESIGSDQWSGDALSSIAGHFGLRVHAWPVTDRENVQKYIDVRTIMAGGMANVSLPYIGQMHTDLVLVKKKTTNHVSIHLPQTTDGRHCDWAPTLVGGLSQYVDDLRTNEEMSRAAQENDKALRASLRQYEREQGQLDDDEWAA